MSELIDKIEKEAKSIFSKAKSSHDWEHTQRVCNLCALIGKKEKVDMEIFPHSQLYY